MSRSLSKMTALPYVKSLWCLRSRGLKPDISFVDYIEEMKQG
jgi:hypothetical protein